MLKAYHVEKLVKRKEMKLGKWEKKKKKKFFFLKLDLKKKKCRIVQKRFYDKKEKN